MKIDAKDALDIVTALDSVVTVALVAGVNVARYIQMREASSTKTLTLEQIDELAIEASHSIARL